ncbi:Uncharacterised protein [Bordetella pertussis]|nr:Uncharacterised protein [Bordetella pertussis]
MAITSARRGDPAASSVPRELACMGPGPSGAGYATPDRAGTHRHLPACLAHAASSCRYSASISLR